MCRSGRNCSRCRVCPSSQGPETKVAGGGGSQRQHLFLISLTQPVSGLMSPHNDSQHATGKQVPPYKSIPKHCSDPSKLEAPQLSHGLYMLLSLKGRKHSRTYTRACSGPQLQSAARRSGKGQWHRAQSPLPWSPKAGITVSCQSLQGASSPSAGRQDSRR